MGLVVSILAASALSACQWEIPTTGFEITNECRLPLYVEVADEDNWASRSEFTGYVYPGQSSVTFITGDDVRAIRVGVLFIVDDYELYPGHFIGEHPLYHGNGIEDIPLSDLELNDEGNYEYTIEGHWCTPPAENWD